jgi:hypothetical protein
MACRASRPGAIVARVPRKRTSRLHPAVLAWLKEQAVKGGKSRARSLTARQRQKIARAGGQARARQMTVRERRELGRLAARARWARQAKPPKRGPSPDQRSAR